jgi:hypothetical protein
VLDCARILTVPLWRATTRTRSPLFKMLFWDLVKLFGLAVAEAAACGAAAPVGAATMMQIRVASRATMSFEVPLTLSPVGSR